MLELIATRIFYRFLNIYKISRISREQNVVEIRRLKSHPVSSFKQQKTFHIEKQSLSFQNMVLKLWATHEMNLWEREIQGALD